MRSSRLEAIYPAKVDLRALAAVSRFCGADDARAYLMGVRVEVGPRDVVYIATDGKRLLALRQEKFRDDPDNDLTGRFTIPTPHCRAFKLKKDQDPIADLYGDNERLTLQKGDVEVTFTPLQDGEFVGRWVDWRHIIPRPARSAEAGQFDHAQLATFQKFADDMPGGFYPYVVHNGRDGGALVRFSNMDAIGVVMPVKLDDQRMAPLPSWATSEDFRSWDRYRSSRDADDGDAAADAGEARNLGDAVDDLVDRLRPNVKESHYQDQADAPTETTEQTSTAAPGDDLAAAHQADAIGGSESLSEDKIEALSPEQRQNVERLQGIAATDVDEGERIDEAEEGGGATVAKPKRRGRRSVEQRVADNTAAVAGDQAH